MKRIVNTLLQLIDFLPKEAFIIFATNDVSVIDKALMRRVDIELELPLPSEKLIVKYLKYRLKPYKKFL
jgi:SpoVK/Ycf46/Vps4 family AAA+-type ATPase